MLVLTEAKQGNFIVFQNDAFHTILTTKKDYEPHFYNVAKNVVKQGDICIDCGANMGYHTVTLAKLVGPNGNVLAFEPLRIIYQQLNGNIFINGLRNVTCFNLALGNDNKIVQMDPLDLDSSSVNIGGTKIGGGGENVEMVKLDQIVTNGVSFVKIDVQGSEVSLLEGADKLIKNSRPVIFIEVENHYLNCFGQTSEILLNKLLSLDYILVRIMNEYPCDHIAVPREKKDLLDLVIKDVGFPTTIIDGKSVSVKFDRDDDQQNIHYGSFTVS